MRLRTFFFVLLMTLPAMAADVPFTAHLQNFSSAPTDAYLLVSLDATTCPAGSLPATSAGVKSLAKQTLSPDGAGLVSATITPTADIHCAAVTGATEYVIEVMQRGVNGGTDKRVSYGCYTVAGAFTLETATPNVCPTAVSAALNPVVRNPTGNQPIAQPSGTSLSVIGAGGVDFSAAGYARPFPYLLFANFLNSCVAHKDRVQRADPATAGQVDYVCNAAGNGWDLVGDGGSGGGGSGTVTSFSTGNLSPLFSASVANPTTTPALSFGLSTAGPHLFFGNNSGSTAAPSYSAVNSADIGDASATTSASKVLRRDANGRAAIGAGSASFSTLPATYFTGLSTTAFELGFFNPVAGFHGSEISTNSAVIENQDPASPGLYGTFSAVFQNAASGTIPEVVGGGTESHLMGAGNAVEVRGFETAAIFDSTGSATNASGYYARQNLKSSTGAPTNNYGVYIEPQTIGTSSNYGVYSAGTEPNRFLGPVQMFAGANNLDLLRAQRFTDTSPTGNLINITNAAGGCLWDVDIAGSLSCGTIPAARISGAVATATALAADGTDCGAGQYARGVDAQGNAQGCTSASGAGTVTNTGGTLTNNAVMLGAGGADSKVMASLGTATTLLHGNASGAPTYAAVDLANDVGASVLAKANQNAQTVYKDQANSYTAGMKQTVTADATNPGFKFGGVGSDPSSPTAGDEWYRTDLGLYRGRDASTTHSFAFLDSNITGSAAALTANGTNCSAGNYAVGVDASGNAEGCSTDGSSLTTLNASNLSSGTVPAGRLPALLGAVTSSAGSATTSAGVRDLIDASGFCSDAGSTDTYACNLSPAIGSYVTGTHYRFKANTANTGAASINFNSLGTKTIKKAPGGITTDLVDNDIRVGQWVDLVYDGTNMQMQSTSGNAAAGSSPLTTAGDIYGRNATVDARIPVGRDKYNLTADAASALGVKWQSPMRPLYRVQRWLATATGNNRVTVNDTEAATIGTLTTGNASAGVPAMVNYATATTVNATFGDNDNLVYFRSESPDFQTIGKFTTATDYAATRIFFGFSDQTVATMNNADVPAGNYAGFMMSTTGTYTGLTDTTNWVAIQKDNTTQSACSTSIAFGATTVHKFEIYANEQTGNVEYYVDGSIVCTLGSNRPASTTAMRMMITGQNLTAGTARNFQAAFLYGEHDPF